TVDVVAWVRRGLPPHRSVPRVSWAVGGSLSCRVRRSCEIPINGPVPPSQRQGCAPLPKLQEIAACRSRLAGVSRSIACDHPLISCSKTCWPEATSQKNEY